MTSATVISTAGRAERVAALAAALAAHEPGVAQLGQDVLQEAQRDLLRWASVSPFTVWSPAAASSTAARTA
jgi:hypothetical protein